MSAILAWTMEQGDLRAHWRFNDLLVRFICSDPLSDADAYDAADGTWSVNRPNHRTSPPVGRTSL